MTGHCMITGANGYLGAALCRHFVRQGWRVTALSRRPPADDGFPVAHVRWELGDAVDPATFDGVAALVHAAHDFRPVRRAELERVNVEGALPLLRAAVRAGVPRRVLISSMSAFSGCRSDYGRAKLALEKAFTDHAGGVAIRPGLVYGGKNGGTFGSLVRVAASAPVVPLVGDGTQVQYLAHVGDLCRLVERACTGGLDGLRTPVTAAAPRPVALRSILELLAREHGRRLRFLRLPFTPLLLALKVLERTGLRAGLRSDSLVSLVHPCAAPDFAPLARLGVTFREFDADGLHRDD